MVLTVKFNSVFMKHCVVIKTQIYCKTGFHRSSTQSMCMYLVLTSTSILQLQYTILIVIKLCKQDYVLISHTTTVQSSVQIIKIQGPTILYSTQAQGVV